MNEIEIGGKHRPINFGISALGMYCREKGIPLTKMEGAFEDMDLQDLTNLIYFALLAGYRRARVEVDFEKNDVLDWLDDTESFTRAMEAWNNSQTSSSDSKKKLAKGAANR
jgi:hypothetical protein